jgi:hypothetical protein
VWLPSKHVETSTLPVTCCSPPATALPSPATPSAPGSGDRLSRSRVSGFEVRVHDLRHAHASWLLACGSDLKAVMDRMGHAPITTTQKSLHPMPDTDQKNVTASTASAALSSSTGSLARDRTRTRRT